MVINASFIEKGADDVNWVWIWLAVIIVAALLEVFSVQLVAIWFSLGAIVSMIAAHLGLEPVWQIVIFLAVSIVLILSTRRVVKKILTPKLKRTNADRLIGMECVITEDIDNLEGRGAAKVLGQDWTARAVRDDIKLSAGDKAVIREISGVKLMVEPVSEA